MSLMSVRTETGETLVRHGRQPEVECFLFWRGLAPYHEQEKLLLITRLWLKGEVSWGFFTGLVKNGEIRPSHSYKTILEQREERDQLSS